MQACCESMATLCICREKMKPREIWSAVVGSFFSLFIVLQPLQGLADDTVEVSATTVVGLIVPEPFEHYREILGQQLHKWNKEQVSYTVFSSSDAAPIQSAFDYVAQGLSENSTPLFLYFGGGNNKGADILVVFDHRASDALDKYHIDISDIAFQQPQLNQKKIQSLLSSTNSQCEFVVSFKYGTSEIIKAFLFVSIDLDEYSMKRCLGRSALVALGLTTMGVPGDTIMQPPKDPGTDALLPTTTDFAALQLLYTKGALAGDTIDHLLRIQTLFPYDPSSL